MFLLRCLVVFSIFGLTSSAAAKDLRGHLGVGFNTTLPHAAGLAVAYGLPTGDAAIEVGIEAIAALSIADGTRDVAFAGGRMTYALATEDNMNFYGAAGAGFVTEGDNQNIRLQPALGAQFFLFGLENLGFLAEWGLSIDLGESSSVSGGTGVGLYYYF